jgi:hypothetical protein
MMIDLVFDLQKRDLSWSEKAVAICLATHINHKHPEKGTWVGISTIMAETSMSRSTVEHAMTSLRRRGVVVRLGYEVGRQARMPIHDVRPAAAPLHPKFALEPASIADSEPAPNADSQSEPAREPAQISGEPAQEPASIADLGGEPAREPAPNADELTEQEKNQREKSKEKKKASPPAQPALSPSLSAPEPGGQQKSTARLLAEERLQKANERAAIRSAQTDPEVMALSGQLIELTRKSGLEGENLLAAAELLKQYDRTSIYNAFREFYSEGDDFEQLHAIRKFFAGGMAPAFIENQRQYHERQEEQQRLAVAARERALAKEEAESSQDASEEDDEVRPEDLYQYFGAKPTTEPAEAPTTNAWDDFEVEPVGAN